MKIFAKNTLITFLSKILGLIVALVVSIIITRSLGPEGKGIYSLVILFPGILLNLFNFGVQSANIFYTGKREYSLSNIFSGSIYLSFFSTFFSVITGVIVIFLLAEKILPNVPVDYLLISLFFLPINFFLYFITSILLGQQKFWHYNLLFLFSNIFQLLLVIFLIKILDLGILGAIIAYVLYSLPSAILIFIIMLKLTGSISLNLDLDYLKKSLSFGIKSYFSQIFYFLDAQINLLLVGFFMNPVAVGFFSVANDIVIKSQPLTESAAMVLFPKIVAEDNEENRKLLTPIVCRNIIFIYFLGTLLLFFIVKQFIVFLYSEDFLDSVQPFIILLPVLVVSAGSQILAADFVGRGKPMINTYINGFSLLINIILSVFLIPVFGIAGAAFAMTTSFIVMFILKLIIYSRISQNRIRDIIFISFQDIIFYKNFINLSYITIKNILIKKRKNL